MSEQNQNSKGSKMNSSSTQPSSMEASKLSGTPAVPATGWRKLLSKKWVFPALYVTAAALILTLVWIYQGSNQQLKQNPAAVQTEGKSVTESTTEPATGEAVEVMAGNEVLGWPVLDAQAVDVVMGFYDANATKEEQEKAVVQHNQTFTPNVGIDLARKDQKPFDVVAALSGTVVRAEAHPTMGNVVEIDHGNGLKTLYQSVTDLKVKKGEAVKKGDAIAIAGTSEQEKGLGVHVHFSVYENDKPVNPTTLLTKNQ